MNWIVTGFIGLVVAVAIGKAVSDAKARNREKSVPQTAGLGDVTPLPRVRSSGANNLQPPGPVPPGKVWSAEHGHWHDVPAAGGSATAASRIPAAQPPGPVPAGKVWSSEHGHWHDAAPTAATPAIVSSTAQSAPTAPVVAEPASVATPDADLGPVLLSDAEPETAATPEEDLGPVTNEPK